MDVLGFFFISSLDTRRPWEKLKLISVRCIRSKRKKMGLYSSHFLSAFDSSSSEKSELKDFFVAASKTNLATTFL